MTLEERYERLPLEQVIPSKTNPRTHFSDAYLADLANSIAEKGVVQPILVRPREHIGDPAGLFEIVVGECRYRASKLAKQPTIPAIIRDLSDDQVLELQLIENIHRKDLTALEQAAGYRALIKANPGKHTAASIAQRLGMSEAWVWDRLKLNDLVPEAKQLLERGQMATGHAILVARQTPANQKRLIDPKADLLFVPVAHGPRTDLRPVSVRELEVAIARTIRLDIRQAAQAAPLRFGAALTRVSEARATPGKGAKVVAITFEVRAPEATKDADERTYGLLAWRRADGTKQTQPVNTWGTAMKDAPTCEHSVLGVVVAGAAHYGETFRVCVARDACKVHFGKEIAERAKNAKRRPTGSATSTARAAASARQQAQEAARRAQAEARWKVFFPALKRAVEARLAIQPAKLPAALYAKVLADHKLPTATKPADLAKALLVRAVADEFSHSWSGNERDLVKWATALGVNVKACEPLDKPTKKAS